MSLRRNTPRGIVPVGIALVTVFAFGSCGDRKPPPPAATPAATPANVAPAPTSSAPVIPAGSGTDVESKKGTATGMVGGEAGTVGSSGKPGTGTASGAGTGAAQSSDEKIENKK